MRKYREISFYTLGGVIKQIDLGDSAYGEWIIYEDGIPKYHVNVFNKSISDKTVERLLKNKSETINSILKKINIKQKKNLSLNKKMFIRLIKESKLIALDLHPLPDNWVENIIQCKF